MALVCNSLDSNDVCIEWVELLPLGLPQLSMADALALSSLIVTSWVISYSFVVVIRMLSKR